METSCVGATIGINTSLVGNRKLSDVDKFLYLTSTLKGDAKKLLEGLPATNLNYSIAIDLLRSHYGRPDLVKDAHYTALNKVKAAGDSLNECRAVYNEIEKHLRILSAMGEDTTQSHLRFLILGKFPENLVYELMKRVGGESVTAIRKALEELINAKEDAARFTNHKAEKESNEFTTEALHVSDIPERRPFNQNSYNKRFGSQNRSYSSNKSNQQLGYTYRRKRNFPDFKDLRNSSSFTPKRSRVSCYFCNDDHHSEACDKYKSVPERKIFLGNRCYLCLSKGHMSRNCDRNLVCWHCNSSYHHRALCPTKDRKTIKSSPDANTKHSPNRKETEKAPTVLLHIDDATTTAMQTAIVELKSLRRDHKLVRRVLLDGGSMRSYITQELARELQLIPVEEDRLTVFTFGTNEPREIISPRVKLQIVTRSKSTLDIFANVVPIITRNIPFCDPIIQEWKTKVDLADDGSLEEKINLLIGNDYYFTLLLGEKIKLRENLYLVSSDIGWLLGGKVISRSDNDLEVFTYFQSSYETKLNPPDPPIHDINIKDLWELEAIGIIDSPKENREEEAIRNFNETTHIEDNRYQVSLPWIEYPPNLETNYGLALGRLTSLLKRLDSNTKTAYDQLIKEQERMGVIEVIPPEEVYINSHPVHYLPHHGIKQENKPIRIVYDGSSKTTQEKKSLNQCLYCGPLMLEDLTGLLLKFRTHNVGVCADVEKAFLQVGLQRKDRDVTRFLWIKDLDLPVDDNNLVYMRFCRVPFGIISSPFLLNATIRNHLSQSEIPIVKNLAQYIYVDNLVTGTNNSEEALELYTSSKRSFMEMSMNLRQWSSNSHTFMTQIEDGSPDEVTKVLGLDWNVSTDTLHLRTKDLKYPNTKRGVLKRIASIYDPCGYAAPIALPAKLFLQNLWKMKFKWDKQLPEPLAGRWKSIQEELNALKETSIPRCYKRDFLYNKYELHCFTDASTQAYAAVVYIVQDKITSFVVGKCRLVPTKDHENLKIPRLELLASLIGSRLIQFVKKHLPNNISRQVLWTDSQIVVDWYCSDKLLTPFVSRRIQEMKKNKDLEVRHVPSGLNPADVATRPDLFKVDIDQWMHGPAFLSQPSSEWPVLAAAACHTVLTLEGHQEERKSVEKKNPIKNKTVSELNLDSMYMNISKIKEIQAHHFHEELKGKDTSLRRNLGLFRDQDGLLRCEGRMKYANWTYDKRYPILLPSNDTFTDDIIMKIHNDNYHVGAPHTLNIIRQSYWIPKGKRQVLKVINKCPQCIKHGGGPFKLPPTPALPPERVNYSEPYTFTGMDYLGPIMIKTNSGTEKRWICLFTCLAIRAVHLEVVQDLSAEEGLLALRRFTSTRNVPELITSDNATNFKLMSEVLTQPYCIDRKIKWRFIPQLAPWFGGFYERLIGIIKNCMRRTLQKHLLTDSQLSTITKEIEATVNTRPLTYVDEETDHVLTPSDFISMGRTIGLDVNSDGPAPNGTQTKCDLINSWKRGITILNEFKDMFTNQYLLSLRERYSHCPKQPRCTSRLTPSLGQTVQIRGESKNRENWLIGKIISVTKGSDGLCRVAQVKIGERIYTRSIAHLYPLEIEEREALKNVPVVRIEEPSQEPTKNVDIEETEMEVDPEEDNKNTHHSNIDIQKLIYVDTLSEKASHTEPALPYVNNVDSIHIDDTIGASPVPRQPREAAVKAREKIRQWTSALVVLLPAAGSVANVSFVSISDDV